MLNHYVRIFLRGFKRLIFFNLLTILSLSLGLACVLFIYSYIRFESSFDGFHQNAERVYRIVFAENRSYERGSTMTPMVLSDVIKEAYGNATFVRLNNAGGARVNFKRGENKFQESRFYFTDSTFFKVFSFNLIEGNAESCLKDPFTMVISQTAAQKYFGPQSALNEVIEIEWGPTTYPVRITGLMKDTPANSHVQFDFLISNTTAQRIFSPPSFFTDWTANFCYTYTKLPELLHPTELESKINQLLSANLKSKPELPALLQPIKHIHLQSDLKSELSKNSKQSILFFAALLGIIILLITVINFNSLYTSVYEQKAKGVAIQKVLGANAGSIFLQSVGELMFTSLLATALALIWLSSGLLLSGDSGNHVNTLLSLSGEIFYGIVFLLIILFALVALPVRTVSQTNPLSLFKSGFMNVGGASIRSIFLAVQFIMSIALIGVYLIINQQLSYVENAETGYAIDNRIILPHGRTIRKNSESVKEELRKVRGVGEVTLSSNIPTGNLNLMLDSYPEGKAEKFSVAAVSVDFDFFTTYNINVTRGRTFSPQHVADSTQSLVINEAMAKELGWAEPIGKKIRLEFNAGDGSFENREGTVIGVVADIHFESMHRQVKPLIYFCKPFWFYYVTLHLNEPVSPSSLNLVATSWNKLVPEAAFEYTLMEDRYQKMYAQEQNWSNILQKFLILSVLLTLSGVLGMISFLLFKSKREIIIRKIHGAQQADILVQFNKGILKIFGLSLVLSVPLIVLLNNSVTASLYYKSPVSIATLAVGVGGLLLLIMLLTSTRIYFGYHSSQVSRLAE